MKYSFIFDFDCTLTHYHFFWFIHDPEKFRVEYPSVSFNNNLQIEIYKYIKQIPNIDGKITYPSKNSIDKLILTLFHSEDRIKAINSMFKRMHNQGHEVYIASRGIKTDIIRLMDLVGIIFPFNIENITGCTLHKVRRLEEQLQLNSVIYFDDNSDEHEEFISLMNYDKNFSFNNKTENYKSYNHYKNSYYYYTKLIKDKAGGIDIFTLNNLCV